jgi:hypothetical protein
VEGRAEVGRSPALEERRRRIRKMTGDVLVR